MGTELAAGAVGYPEELDIFLAGFSTVAFNDVGWDGFGRPAKLGDELVTLGTRKAAGDGQNLGCKRHRFLVDNEVFVAFKRLFLR